jgi:hypothetical protein
MSSYSFLGGIMIKYKRLILSVIVYVLIFVLSSASFAEYVNTSIEDETAFDIYNGNVTTRTITLRSTEQDDFRGKTLRVNVKNAHTDEDITDQVVDNSLLSIDSNASVTVSEGVYTLEDVVEYTFIPIPEVTNYYTSYDIVEDIPFDFGFGYNTNLSNTEGLHQFDIDNIQGILYGPIPDTIEMDLYFGSKVDQLYHFDFGPPESTIVIVPQMNRIQAVEMYLRNLGLLDEARNYAGIDNFSDISGDEPFANVTAYMKDNPVLGFVGYQDGSFRPYDEITEKEYYLIKLMALGYVYGIDFEWNNVMEFAAEKGLGTILYDSNVDKVVEDFYSEDVFGIKDPINQTVKVYSDNNTLKEYTLLFSDIEFHDAGLEAAVRDELQKPFGNITKADLESITFLDAQGYGIESTEGIFQLTNLWGLAIGYNSISDISELSLLENLEFLNISGNPISDGSEIANIDTLRHLYFANTNIEDLSFLSQIPQLVSLGAGNGDRTNFDVIGSLTNLESLNLVDTNIENIDFISNLTNLNWLSLWLAQVDDISSLSGLTDLEYLDLESTNVSDISPLESLINLEWLYLANTPVTDFSPIYSIYPQLIGRDFTLPDYPESVSFDEKTVIDEFIKPDSGSKRHRLRAFAYNESGEKLDDETTVIELDGSYQGVQIDEQGYLTVDSSAEAGFIKVKASLADNSQVNDSIWIEIFDVGLNINDCMGLSDTIISVPVNIESGSEVAGGDITINYDQNLATLENITLGEFFDNKGLPVINTTTPGEVILSFAYGESSAIDDAIFITLDFLVAGELDDVCQITFESAELYNTEAEALALSTNDGSAILGVLPGDVNGDGYVRSNDAILILRHSAGLTELTGASLVAADMNSDGYVRSNDAILVLRKAAGLD